MVTHLHSLLWALVPWEICLVAGALLWQVTRLCRWGAGYLAHMAVAAIGLLLGLAIPAVLHLPEVWTLPLFATGAGLCALGIIRSLASHPMLRGSVWVRLSRGICCLGVGLYLLYGTTQYASLHAAIGVARMLAFVLAILAALQLATVLIACTRRQSAWSTASVHAVESGQRAAGPGVPRAGETYPTGAPYPFDYPTITNSASGPQAHQRGG